MAPGHLSKKVGMGRSRKRSKEENGGGGG